MLLRGRSRVDATMSQTSLLSSHRLTPRWTHAIDICAQSRREDTLSLAAIGLSLLAVLRDQPVPLAPVPRADLPRRTPQRQQPSMPVKGPTPLSVPQEIESIPEHQAEPPLSATAHSADY
jgi:hypothetical protein